MIEYKRAIISFPGDSLWAPEINVNCITIVLNKLRCLQENIRIVSAKLNGEWPILWTRLEVLRAIFGLLSEQSGVEHRRVADLSFVAPRQHAIRQLRLIDHGCHEELWTANALVIGVSVNLSVLLGLITIDNLVILLLRTNALTRALNHLTFVICD